MSKKQISTVIGIAVAIWLGTTILPTYIPLGRK